MKKELALVEIIRIFRKAQRYSQTEVANMLNISKQAYNAFEKMKATISEEKIALLCNKLGINVDFFSDRSKYLLDCGDSIKYFKFEDKMDLAKTMIFLNECEYVCIFLPEGTLKYFISKTLRRDIFIIFVKQKNSYCVFEVPFIKSVDDFSLHFVSMFRKLNLINVAASYYILEDFDYKEEFVYKAKMKLLTKEDCEKIFSKEYLQRTELSLTTEEKKLIMTVREKNINVSELIKILFTTVVTVFFLSL